MHPRWLSAVVLAAGLTLGSVAAASAATPTTTAPKSSATTMPTSTATTPKRTTRRYEVISGTYSHRASAVKHLDLIRKDGIEGLVVAKIGTKTVWYRDEERGLSRSGAEAKVAKLRAHKLGGRFVLER